MEIKGSKPYFAVIVAGGAGTRMRTEVPKQFIELCGKPILMHAIEAFAAYRSDMTSVVVLPSSQIDYWHELCRRHSFTMPHRITEGGNTRFGSVKNGLSLLPDDGLTAIHDGVRPLVSRKTIDDCFCTAEVYGNAVPAIVPVDSVREITETESRVIDRSKLRLIQTPQVFDIGLLKKAYDREYLPDFTDDASVFEMAGHFIRLTEGNAENIKITTPNDLAIAEALMTRFNAVNNWKAS